MSEHFTYCRICESNCGMIATVKNDQIVAMRPDPDHVLTQGWSCPKGLAMPQVTHNPKRILHPQRKRADGSFERISWKTALREIAERMNHIRAEHGDEAIGFYEGTATMLSYSAAAALKGMAAAFDTKHYYASASMDANPRFVASKLLYGSSVMLPLPDMPHTDFMLIMGSNPVASHGSLIGSVKPRQVMNGIVDRGGRVVVVDPRRTETARYFEHVPIQPDGDSYLLFSMLHVIFAEGLENLGHAQSYVSRLEELKSAVKPYPPEVTTQHTGIAPEVVKQLARDFSSADSAVAYGRLGACTGNFGLLLTFLMDVLNVVTGNIDKRGGMKFGDSWVDFEKVLVNSFLDSYGQKRSRIGGFPDVMGMMPVGILADEINTPGKGQLRAMIVVAGNPGQSVPETSRVKEALKKLDLLVSLEINFTETNQHADYILPTTTFLEREDTTGIGMSITMHELFMQWTDPVISPRGETRQEWEIIRDLCAEMNIVPSPSPQIRRLGWLGRLLTPSPKVMHDLMLRLSSIGDLFGLRPGGLNIKKLKEQFPSGMVRGEAPLGVLPERLYHDDGCVHLICDEIASEIKRLDETAAPDEEYPFRMFGGRESRTMNTWMRNAEKLRVGEPGPACTINPEDAKWLGLSEGELGRVRSRTGSIEARFRISEDVVPGTVYIPHGWSSISAREDFGARNEHFNVNEITTANPLTLEPLTGTATLNGVHVHIEAVNDYRKVAN